MGESALLVSWGNKVSMSLNLFIHRLTNVLRVSLLSGVLDLVPAYSSLLVVFESRLISGEAVHEWLEQSIAGMSKVDAPDAGGVTVRNHVIPVQYGGDSGPDLEELAAREGVRAKDIIKVHTQRPFQVAFLGFLPGFAYMGKLPRRKPVPRLTTPRTRVPTGSVGLAGFQTGIYPFSSPGGWQIIGRTGTRIWNSNSQLPALFAPGDTVKFVESKYEPGAREESPLAASMARPAFEVVHAGGISMIQDSGRTGSMHLGVGVGGVFDPFAAQRANALVGNDANAAVLEIALGGPELRVTRNVTVALDGADFQLRADSVLVPPRLSWFARIGTTLRFATGSSAISKGMRAFLAVRGGFDVPAVLGSRSTSLLAGFGGYEGRVLKAGDVLGVGTSSGQPSNVAGRYWLGKISDISPKIITVRFIPYSGVQAAPADALQPFIETEWLLTEKSDRMGLRLQSLDGSSLPAFSAELASFGVVTGAIQLPPAGQPVVLGPDCQTTGGYPLLGVVIRADMPLLAQGVRGAHVRFVAVEVEEARKVARQAQLEVERGSDLLNSQLLR